MNFNKSENSSVSNATYQDQRNLWEKNEEIESNISQSEFYCNLHEKNKILQQQWYDAEQKCQNLLVENDKLNLQVNNEQRRADRYLEKLTIVQENQKVIERLKELYIKSMKTTEKLKSIEDMECQVAISTTCSQCIKIGQLVEEFNDTKDTIEETMFIKRSELTQVMELFDKLKEKVDEREKSWSLNMQRDGKFKKAIVILHTKVKVLNRLLKIKSDEMENLKKSELDIDIMQKENQLFKKIIIKLEKRYREAEEKYHFPKVNLSLSERETTLLQQLVKKHIKKLYMKRIHFATSGASSEGSGDDERPVIVETNEDEENSSESKVVEQGGTS